MPNSLEAIKYYKKAIELGCTESALNMGLIYLYGKGVKTNEQKGKALIKYAM